MRQKRRVAAASARALEAAVWRRRLQGARIRPTAQRIAVARFVLGEADHPTAEQVKAHLDQQGQVASLATVYNTLELFVARGLLRRLKLPHANHVVYDDNLSAHHHFIDERTRTLFDVPAHLVRIKGDLGPGFEVKDVQVVFRGRARGTAKRPRVPAPYDPNAKRRI